MKYFNINYEDRHFSFNDLKAACKADPVTHIAMVQMLEIQCREDGYQPYIWPDNNGVEILPATKAFLNRTTQPNKTARRVMAKIEEMEKEETKMKTINHNGTKYVITPCTAIALCDEGNEDMRQNAVLITCKSNGEFFDEVWFGWDIPADEDDLTDMFESGDHPETDDEVLSSVRFDTENEEDPHDWA